MPRVFTLKSYQINDFWAEIEPLLETVESREWEPEDVRVELVRARAQLWGIYPFRGIWITKIQHTLSHKWALLWIAAGEGLEEGLELFRTHTEPWLKDQGCEFVQIIGRKGWKRVLRDYEETDVVLVKRL